MLLYQWDNQINNVPHCIYALANDISEAREVAIARSPVGIQGRVREIIQAEPTIFKEPTSFIFPAAARLV